MNGTAQDLPSATIPSPVVHFTIYWDNNMPLGLKVSLLPYVSVVNVLSEIDFYYVNCFIITDLGIGKTFLYRTTL